MTDPSNVLLDQVQILVGDVMDRLREIPSDSVDCIVTSPPYWGLRDYGVVGQLGMEPTLGEHLSAMVDVCGELRRVLKSTGTFWLNYGDCYATKPNGRSAKETKALGNDDRTFRDKPFSTVGGVLKPKDLAMIPNRLAIALQEAGWWVRAECIWAKPNPMPESIEDRPATSHEKVFLLTKSARYYYDADAVRQGRAQDEDANGFRGGSYVGGEPGKRKQRGNHRPAVAGWAVEGEPHDNIGHSRSVKKKRQDQIAEAAGGSSSSRRMAGFNERWDKKKIRASDVVDPRHAGHINHTGIEDVPRGSRSLRNWEPAPLQVWVIATRPFSEAHFATFPPELVERCLLAGCPPGGVVLDPFGGAGTTSLVAAYTGRPSIMIELNEEYVDIARRRLVSAVSKVSGPKNSAIIGDEPLSIFNIEGL